MYHTYTALINCHGRFNRYGRRILAFPRKMICVQVNSSLHIVSFTFWWLSIVFVMSGNRLRGGKWSMKYLWCSTYREELRVGLILFLCAMDMSVNVPIPVSFFFKKKLSIARILQISVAVQYTPRGIVMQIKQPFNCSVLHVSLARFKQWPCTRTNVPECSHFWCEKRSYHNTLVLFN